MLLAKPRHRRGAHGARVRAALCWPVLLAALSLSGCQAPPEVRIAAPDAYPTRLSDWGLLLRRGDRLVLGRDVHPYEVATPLFSDYALKLRAYYLPDGSAMHYDPEQSFDFPLGSVLAKTFFYPVAVAGPVAATAGAAGAGGAAGNEVPAAAIAVQAVAGWNGAVADLDLADYRLIETRLLIRQADGWDALPYVWEGDDAYLRITGAVQPLALDLPSGDRAQIPYVVPARSECASCHATDHSDGGILPIGLKARHLNAAYPGQPDSQLQTWADRGDLSGLPEAAARPLSIVWNDPGMDLEGRARAYLDSNCGHCHNARGAADTSGLLLDTLTDQPRRLGFCKSPVAAGRGTGGRAFAIDPGDPDGSILIYRVETNDPATRMPETGRSVAHAEGVELLRQWVASLPGECV